MAAFECAVGCGDAPTRPPLTIDAHLPDLGPRDAGKVDAGDAAIDAAVTDLGIDDAGTIVGCSSSTPMELFRTAYLVGNQVPYGAEANIDGLMVAATVWTEANYPFYERIAGYMSQTGGVSAPVPVSPSAMAMSTSISVAPNQNGFIVLFDDTASLGVLPADLWTHSADRAGVFMGASATQLLVTPGSAESGGRLVRTTTGYAAAWKDDVTGTMTGVLDASGAFIGSSHAVPSAVGAPSALEPYAIAGSPYFAYFDSDQKVHAIAVAANGSVAGAPITLSAQTTTGNFGIGGSPSGAGLAYELPVSGGKTTLQFRAVNASGTATIAERSITGIGDQGQRPSVASLAGGYLVLFRHVPAVGTAKLRLSFVSASGDPLSYVDLVDTFPAGTRYSVHVSPDNEVYVVYHEAVSLTVGGSVSVNGASVKAIRVNCQ